MALHERGEFRVKRSYNIEITRRYSRSVDISHHTRSPRHGYSDGYGENTDDGYYQEGYRSRGLGYTPRKPAGYLDRAPGQPRLHQTRRGSPTRSRELERLPQEHLIPMRPRRRDSPSPAFQESPISIRRQSGPLPRRHRGDFTPDPTRVHGYGDENRFRCTKGWCRNRVPYQGRCTRCIGEATGHPDRIIVTQAIRKSDGSQQRETFVYRKK